MLYKFKSRATADLIMLELQGRQILEIIGKTPSASGIVTAAQIPDAISALEAAVVASEAPPPVQEGEQMQEDDDQGDSGQSVHLRQRAAPFIDMLRKSAAEKADVVWGV